MWEVDVDTFKVKVRFFFCLHPLVSRHPKTMHNNWQWNLSWICKSTKIWPLTEQQNSGDQFCQISVFQQERKLSISLTTIRVWPNTPPLKWHPTYFFWVSSFGSNSHKQTVLPLDLFSNSWGCPFRRELTVVLLLFFSFLIKWVAFFLC